MPMYHQRYATATILLVNILLCLAASTSATTDGRVAAKTYKKTYIINDIHTLPKKRSTTRYLQGGKDDEKQNNKDEDKEDKPPKVSTLTCEEKMTYDMHFFFLHIILIDARSLFQLIAYHTQH